MLDTVVQGGSICGSWHASGPGCIVECHVEHVRDQALLESLVVTDQQEEKAIPCLDAHRKTIMIRTPEGLPYLFLLSCSPSLQTQCKSNSFSKMQTPGEGLQRAYHKPLGGKGPREVGSPFSKRMKALLPQDAVLVSAVDRNRKPLIMVMFVQATLIALSLQHMIYYQKYRFQPCQSRYRSSFKNKQRNKQKTLCNVSQDFYLSVDHILNRIVIIKFIRKH